MNTQSVNTSLYQKGDISLERIYGKYRNSFIRYAGKVLSDEFYAEDVVQDVFTGLFQQTNYFVSEMAALKCIYIAIYNRSIDMLRHKQIVQHYETAHSDKKREEVSIGEYNELLTKEFYCCPIKILRSYKIRADFICEVSPFSLDFSRQTIKSNHGQKYTF